MASIDNQYYDSILQRTKERSVQSGDFCIIHSYKNINNIFVRKAIQIGDGNNYCLDDNVYMKTLHTTDRTNFKMSLFNGEIVKVFSLEKNGFLRAKIINTNKKQNNYYVEFIDIGKKATIKFKDIYKLSEKLKEPGIIVKVGISDLKNLPCINEVNELFKFFVRDGKVFIIEFDETIENCLANVKFKDITNKSYINEFIVKYIPSGIALQSKEYTSSLYHHINNLNKVNKSEFVYLRYYENINRLFAVNIELFDKVMYFMNQNINTLCTSVNIGDIIKVKNKNSSYRGKVIYKYTTELIEVLNIDYGYYERVNISSVFKLPDDIKEIPKSAQEVNIYKPTLLKKAALMDFLNKNNNLHLQIEYYTYNKASLKIKGSDKVMFKIFLKEIEEKRLEYNKMAMKVLNSCIYDIDEKPHINGDTYIVSHFKDLNHIYLLSIVPNSLDMLHISNIFSIQGNKDDVIKENAAIGDLVKVRSALDDNFYRGKIAYIKNKTIYVSYVDFKSIEVIEPSSIYVLPDEQKKEISNKHFQNLIRFSINVPPDTKMTSNVELMIKNFIVNETILVINKHNKNEVYSLY